MEIGILFDLRNPAPWPRPWPRVYGRALEICEEADRLGAGGVFFSEHHLFADGYLPQVLTFAAAAAARTRRVTVGTAVVLPALRHPAHLAEEAAVVDLISGGRLELGVGAGYRVPEYDLFGVDIGRRFATTERHIREVQRLWAEEVITPLPVQRPVPMWGGFYGPRGARLAGRLGLGLMHISRSGFEHYQAGLLEAGLDPAQARVSDLLPIMLADDPEGAWHRIAPHLAHQMNSYRRYAVEGTDTPVPPPVDPADLRRPRGDGPVQTLQVLTPKEAAEQILAITEGLPVERVLFWASIAGMPDELVDRHVELLCTEVAPLLA